MRVWLCETTVFSQASARGRSQLKRQNLRVGGYTEKVLNSTIPRKGRCEVGCQGVPHRHFVLRRGQPHGNPKVGPLSSHSFDALWIPRHQTSKVRTHSSVASFAVFFPCSTIFAYTCKRRLNAAEIWQNLAWWAVTRRTSKNHKTVIIECERLLWCGRLLGTIRYLRFDYCRAHLTRGFEREIYSRNACAYVCVCTTCQSCTSRSEMSICARVHAEDSCVTCNDTRNIIWRRMPSQAKEDREERRFLTMEDG